MKGLKVFAASLIAQFQPSEVSEPAECALDNISGSSQAATVRPSWTQRSQNWLNAKPLDNGCQSFRAVASIALQYLGFAARTTYRPTDRRHVHKQWQRNSFIRLIGSRGFYNQRQSAGLGQNMAFAACFGPIRGIGAGVRPPKTARTLALSITARSRLMAPALPRIESRATWSWDQTLSRVHSVNRRQQVLPLPHFISRGNICHGIPVLSTNRMPMSTCRFDTRGRPPLQVGRGSGGSSGSSCFQSVSGRSSAMRIASMLNAMATRLLNQLDF